MLSFLDYNLFSMKRITIITYLLLLCGLASGQIITPGFISCTACPTTYSEVYLCTGWRQPTGGTSDYFNICAAGTTVGVPDNYFGYQTAADSAYTGLFTYAQGALYDYKEYIGTSIAPLVVGYTYTMSISVSLSDSSSIATDGLGVFFSTYQLDSPSLYSTLMVTPQVDYSSYGIITDKNNWVTLSKTFVADSAYTNIVVGGFKPTGIMLIDTLSNACNDVIGCYSYYYIGHIGVPDSTKDTTLVSTPVTTVITDTTKHVFPSGFTPNGDSHNDIFRIIASPGCQFNEYTLSIFNRFGQLVFYSENPASGWDGTFNTVPQEIGAYYYMAKIKVNGIESLLKGDITLVR